MDRNSQLDWEALANVPIGADQAAAWRVPSWDAERWSGGGDLHEIAGWRSGSGARGLAIAQAGTLRICCFSLLTFLAQMHTSEPTAGGEWRSSRRVTGLTLLLGMVDAMYADVGRERERTLPWPEGKRFVLNVRHDNDRDLDVPAARSVLAMHRELGTKATWYWRASHLRAAPIPKRLRRRHAGRSPDVLRLVASTPGHEIALHTELMWGGDDERRVVERAAGTDVTGSSAHGDPECFRYQGAPNVLWAARHGIRYTELIQHGHLLPHRFPALGADGAIEILDVICLPHHKDPFDRSMRSGETYADLLPAAIDRHRTAGGMLQVMNHPDLNQAGLATALASIPGDGRLDWTAGDAARWWRATHVAGGSPAAGAVREVRAPDGSITTRTVASDVLIGA